ncbi:hypothetical protein [Bacillus sp. S/N-304-OC-R1]|uniref:hypothetical protein n=1 Tax=Bacillus sp. S/N-304-OC-R1 TaxID=2758034 RepID=UPI001C8D0916|nr:hypothetical protein [Bacillus sp. S/N-304-OC-R1]MBY0121142.1 hypothetical protein [Bacillus sp. S/N-304-OC-R1]
MSSTNDHSIQNKMEKIFQHTFRSWENCTETSIKDFLEQCLEQGIDPQYCMSWVEQHKSQIPDWQGISQLSLNWVNEHTSTGSPVSFE